MTTSDTKVAEIVEMYDAGLSPKAIAEELDLAHQTVRNVLKAHGRGKRPSFGTNRQAIEDVVARYQSGESVKEIIADHGITYNKVYEILAQEGIEIRAVAGARAKKARLDAAVDMYIEGAPLWQIIEDTGVAQPTLHAEIHRRGVPLRRPRRIRSEEDSNGGVSE